MESKRMFVAVAAMLMLFAGQCHSAPSTTNARSRKGHKMDLSVCDPLCFLQCAIDGSDFYCYGKCMLQCMAFNDGKPDPDNPREICLATCVVPGCAKLCTKEHPFPRKELKICLQNCSDTCQDIEADKIH